MINPDTREVFALSDYFGQMAHTLQEYIDFNKGNLQTCDRNKLYDAQIDLIRFAGEINMIGVGLVFEDVQSSLTQLEKITEEIKKTVKKALAVQDAINIAAGLVTIATSIIAKDPEAIVKSTAQLVQSMKLKI